MEPVHGDSHGVFFGSSRIGSVTLEHCIWEVNMVAHNLARYAFDSMFFPSFILQDVINDVASFDL